MSTPTGKAQPSSGGGGAAMVFVVIGGVVLLLVLLGVGASIFLFRSSPTVAPPTVVISPVITAPIIPTIASTGTAGAASGLGTKLRTFGSAGTGPGQLDDARQLAVDLDENVYVADYDDGRVQKLNKDGKFQWIASMPKNTLSGDLTIFGLATDTKGTLWVNRTGDIFQLSTKDGAITGTVKGNYDTTWFRYLAIAPTGEIATFHSAAGDTDFLRLDAKGKVVSRLKNKDAKGVAMDGKKNAYILEEYPDAVEVIDEKGAVVSKFGSKSDPHFSGADAIAVDGAGHVFLGVSSGISIFDSGGKYIGEVKTKAYARSIAVSNSGHLFILTNTSTIEVYELGKLE